MCVPNSGISSVLHLAYSEYSRDWAIPSTTNYLCINYALSEQCPNNRSPVDETSDSEEEEPVEMREGFSGAMAIH